MNQLLNYVTITFLLSTLAACGGGGGGGGSNSGTGTGTGTGTATDYPIRAARNSLITNGEHYLCNIQFTFTAAGTSHSASGPCNHDLTAAAAATFQGQAGLSNTNTDSSTLTDDLGHVTSTTDVFTFYYDSNYNKLADVGSDGSFTVVTESHPLPITGKVGDTGSLDSESSYEDSTKSTLTGTQTGSYAIEADSETSIILHVTLKIYDETSTLDQTEDTRYKIDKNGNINFVSDDVVFADGSGTIHVTPQ